MKLVAKYLELRRHTANDGDELTERGIAAAVELGTGLEGGYAAVWSSGAQRATQTAACLIAGLGQPIAGGVRIQADLRSLREDEWRAAYAKAGAGDLESLGGADPKLLAEDSAVLGRALHSMLEDLADGERGLAIGHSPTNEAAVYGLTGEIIAPCAKGGGVLIEAVGATYVLTPLP